MALQSLMSAERSHAQTSPDTLPSGSLTTALSDPPMYGWSDEKVSIPASSKLVTLMVTYWEASVPL